jgi:hypothetical protein
VVEKRRNILGKDTLKSMQSLATTYWWLGKFQAAERLYITVLEKRQKILGEEHPDSQLTTRNLAQLQKVIMNGSTTQ